MALTKISTGGVKDDAASQAIIADEAVDEARLQISNAGSNGQFLQKQSGNTGGLTWATPTDTNTQVGGSTGVDFDDSVKARFGTGNDLEIYHASDESKIVNSTGSIWLQSDTGIRFTDHGLNQSMAAFYDNGACELYHNGTKKIETTAAGVTVTGTVTDADGDIRTCKIATKTGAYVLTADDTGRVIYISTGGVTNNNSVMSGNEIITIINNSGSNQTITQGSGMTMYNTADASSGNRTLAGRGMATIWFASASVSYISGAGLS